MLRNANAFDKSLEHGMTKGLSLIPGDVIKFLKPQKTVSDIKFLI